MPVAVSSCSFWPFAGPWARRGSTGRGAGRVDRWRWATRPVHRLLAPQHCLSRRLSRLCRWPLPQRCRPVASRPAGLSSRQTGPSMAAMCASAAPRWEPGKASAPGHPQCRRVAGSRLSCKGLLPGDPSSGSRFAVCPREQASRRAV